MIAGDTILAESEALPPMFCVGHDSKYHLVLYWTDVKEPKKTKDNEEWFDEIYKKWALQEILRRNAEQYTNLLVGKDIVKVKYVDEILKDPDGNTPSIGQMHVRNDIPSLCARFDVVDAKNRKKAENGVVLVTDEYLEKHTRLSVKSMNTSTKKLPANVVNDMFQLNKKKEEFIKDYGREPNFDELKEMSNMSEDKLLDILQTQQGTVSLDTIIYDEENGESLGDCITNNQIINPIEYSREETKKETILNVLNTLDEREKDILIKRFGLDNGIQKSLDQVGEMVGLTRERVRQIEISALTKLRNPARAKILMEYM